MCRKACKHNCGVHQGEHGEPKKLHDVLLGGLAVNQCQYNGIELSISVLCDMDKIIYMYSRPF